MEIVSIIIILIAGIGAGIVTGLVGASAVIVMAPILILFLGMDPYLAIGLSLGTDVIASLVAGRIYYKYKHVDLKPVTFLLLFAFIGIIIGSYLSTFISSNDLSGITGIATFLTGLAFMKNKSKNSNKSNRMEKFRLKFRKKRDVWLSIIGLLVGLNAGIFGAGGGIALLLILVFLLGYEMHIAIGTSIIIMIFMAFLGGAAHYFYQPFKWTYLLVACVGAFVGSRYSSIFANRISEDKLKKIAGTILMILGLMLTTKIFFW